MRLWYVPRTNTVQSQLILVSGFGAICAALRRLASKGYGLIGTEVKEKSLVRTLTLFLNGFGAIAARP